MISFIPLLTVCAIQVLRVESHITKRDMYLIGPVIEKRDPVDWMQCLIACSTTNDCVSYNFEPRSGICELLSEGLDPGRHCHGRKFLISSQGWIFHQITDTFWSSWSQWTTQWPTGSHCTQQTRKRKCISYSNGECSGKDMEERALNSENCPGEHWSTWSQWNTCSCSNGAPVRARKRLCCCPSNSQCGGKNSENDTEPCSECW